MKKLFVLVSGFYHIVCQHKIWKMWFLIVNTNKNVLETLNFQFFKHTQKLSTNGFVLFTNASLTIQISWICILRFALKHSNYWLMLHSFTIILDIKKWYGNVYRLWYQYLKIKVSNPKNSLLNKFKKCQITFQLFSMINQKIGILMSLTRP